MPIDINDAIRELVREVVREVLAEEREARSSGSELLTTAEAGTIAKLGAPTIREWVRLGQLRAIKVGRSIRIVRADLDAALSGPRIRPRNKPLDGIERARRDHLILVGK